MDGRIETRDFVRPDHPGAYRIGDCVAGTICLGPGDPANLGPNCKVKTPDSEIPEPGNCRAVNRAGARAVGMFVGIAHCLRQCMCNAHNGLCNRHGARAPVPTVDVCEVLESFARAALSYSSAYCLNEYRDPAVWILKWQQVKQELIRQSQEKDEILPDRVKAMIKREQYHKMPKKSRLIQFHVNMATQAEGGPKHYALQKALGVAFRNLEVFPGIDVTFASGMNADEISTWMRDTRARGARCYRERDGANWDATQTENFTKFRVAFYACFDEELADFALKCSVVRGFCRTGDGVLSYRLADTVKSGHGDTTYGNSLCNAAVAAGAAMRCGRTASILVAGDDLVMALYEDGDAKALDDAESAYGIAPESRVFDLPEQTTFCSGTFIGEDLDYVPIPGRLLLRLWWTVTNPGNGKKLDAYRRGVARGLLPACWRVPVIRVWIAKFDSEGPAAHSDRYCIYKGVVRTGEVMYEWASKRYGVSAAELMACEDYLLALPAEPLLVVHPVLERIVEVDMAAIEVRDYDA